MATVVQPLIDPDPDAIKAHLAILFAPCVEHYPQGLIELRHGAAFQSAYFGIHTRGIDDAAAFAADRTRAGSNVYVGVNPRRPETNTRGAASAADIEVAFFQFSDLDDEDAVAAAGRRLKALPPTFTITTGTAPHRRPHFYWQLEEPVGNLAAWSERQQGIAQALDGDKVIDPPRIMRLAGTVNWPDQKKLQRGYKPELVTLKTEFEDEREPVTPEQIAAAYPVRTAANDTGAPLAGETTLSAMRQTQIGDLIAACCSGDQWHNSMIRLVAHLAAKGRTSAEIMALADHITLPGYSAEQTRREMVTALQSARSKWALPEPEDEPVEAEEQAREAGDAIFELLDLDAIELIPPPTYLVDGLIPDDGLSIMYGDPGAGKSFLALDLALRLANSMDWHGTKARPAGVLYIAGEAQKGVANRIKGWRRQHNLMGVSSPFVLLPCAVQLLDAGQRKKLLRSIDAAIELAGFSIGLIVVDTVSRALSGADENGQESMSAFVSACDEIKRHAGGALLGVHHTGKDKERGMRGSSVLLGGCDASFKVTKDKASDIVTIENEKQKDSEEAENIYLKLSEYHWGEGLGKEMKTLVPFRSEAPVQSEETLSNEQIAKAFGAIADAWGAGRPLSTSPNTREQGRYAPSVLAGRIGASEAGIKPFLRAWLETNCLAIEEVDSHSKTRGLRVINPIVKGA